MPRISLNKHIEYPVELLPYYFPDQGVFLYNASATQLLT